MHAHCCTRLGRRLYVLLLHEHVWIHMHLHINYTVGSKSTTQCFTFALVKGHVQKLFYLLMYFDFCAHVFLWQEFCRILLHNMFVPHIRSSMSFPFFLIAQITNLQEGVGPARRDTYQLALVISQCIALITKAVATCSNHFSCLILGKEYPFDLRFLQTPN